MLDEGFRNLLGMGGGFQISLSVYGKTGKPCPNCGSPIRRIVQTGRSSFFCPQCQQ